MGLLMSPSACSEISVGRSLYSSSVTTENPSAMNSAEYTQMLRCPAKVSIHSPVAGFQTLGVRTIEDP